MRRRYFLHSILSYLLTRLHHRTMSNFTVNKNQIIDPNGKPYVPFLINMNGPNWFWGRDTIADLWAVKLWKFNAIRLCTLLKKNVSPPDKYNSSNGNANIDAIISAYTKAGIVCIVEAHDQTGNYFTDSSIPSLADLTSYFSKLAANYINNPYVWFNVQNEPGPISSQWLITHQTVIKAIRATGNNNVIICDGAYWGQDVGEWNTNLVKESNSAILTYGPTLNNTFSNVIYSIHCYDQWVYGDAKLQDFITKVISKGLCLIVGEMGMFNNGISTIEASKSVLRLAKNNGVGVGYWAWDGTDANKLTTTYNGGGWALNDTTGAKPTNLNEIGSLLWDYSR